MATVEERHPELFKPDLHIDRQSGIRTVPMEVMNLGFPRTGTMSMQTALNILGYRCYHSILLFSNIRDCAAWNAAQDAKFFSKGTPFTKTEWDALLGTSSAVSADPPAVAFAEELISTYPEAKVILVERDLEAWYESFDKAVMEPSWSPFLNFLGDWDPWIIGPIRDTHHRWIRGWWGVNSKEEMQAKARDMYRSHYELVRRITPPERLLEYRLGDGWEPLCAFLGKEVPEVNFPRVNDREHHREFLGIVVRRSAKNVLWNAGRVLLPVVAVLFASWWVWPTE